MSSIVQRAALEGSIAEAELTDEEGELVTQAVADGADVEEAIASVLERRGPGDLAGEEQAAPDAPSGEPSEAQLRKLEQQVTRHERKVREIMGGAVEGFTPCEACGGVGLQSPAPRPQAHANFRACDTCNGYGEVLTGSRRPGEESAACPTCQGRGYLERLGPDGSPLGAVVLAVPNLGGANPTPPAPLEPPATGQASSGEQWGVPAWMGNPNLGNP